MGNGINRATILGHMGQDPEVHYTANGAPVVKLSVATKNVWKDKAGNKQEETEWHRIVSFGKLAEIMAAYLHKGSHVYLEGMIKTRKWQDKNGLDRYSTEIIADKLEMLSAGSVSPPPQQRQETPVTTQASQGDQPPVDDGFDEIPF